jgi:hypothetical protein
MYKLGATTHHMIYRDLTDSDKTIFTNNNVDIIKISGIDGLTAIDIQQQNPIMKFTSLNTSVTAHSTISLGLTGGDSWNLSAGVSGLTNADTDFGFHISKNSTELVTIRNNGNIGFGTTNPEYGLDIASNTRTQGDYFVTGNIFVQGVTGGNTGFFNNLWVAEGSTDTSLVLSGGVGLGITNPTNKLDVIGSIGVSGNIIPLLHDTFDLGTTAIRFRDIFLSSNTIHLDGVQMSSNNTQLVLNGSLNVPTDLSVSGDMTLNGELSGNVSFADNVGIGIGSTTSSTILQIGDTSPEFRITDTRTDYGGIATDLGSIGFWSNDTSGGGGAGNHVARILVQAEDGSGVNPDGRLFLQTAINGVLDSAMTIDSAGFVGIGTTAPTAKFQVSNFATTEDIIARVSCGNNKLDAFSAPLVEKVPVYASKFPPPPLDDNETMDLAAVPVTAF